MPTRLLVLCGLLGLIGCRGVEDGGPEVDEPIVAVAVLSGQGPGSELTEWLPGEPLPVVTYGEGPHIVLGYSRAQLEPLGDGWRTGRLRVATGCEASLPSAAWGARIVDGVQAPLAPEDIPAVTVDGLLSTCPSEEEVQLVLDVRGTTGRCEHRVLRTGCAIEIQASCGLDTLDGWLHPDGGFCFEHRGGDWRCRETTVRSGEALECLEPLLEVEVVAQRPGPPPFEVATATVVDRPLHLPRLWEELNQLYAANLDSGLAYSMVPLADRVVVLHTLDGPGGDCLDEPNQPVQFSFVDPDSMAIVGSAPAPLCARELIADPGGQTFFGLTLVDDQSFGLGRFDAQGTLLQHVSIPGASRWQRRLRGLVDVPGQDLVVFFAPPGPGTSQTVVHSYRRSDFAPVATSTLTDVSELLGAAWVGEDTVLAATGLDRFLYLDTTRLTVRERATYPEENLYPVRFVSVFSPEVGDAFMPTNSSAGVGALRQLRRGGLGQIRLPIEASFVPAVATGWRDGLWLVGGLDAESSTRASAVSFYDPAADRFLPGMWRFGAGVISFPQWDAAGRLWVLHPWAGKVSRLTPR